MIKSLLLLFMLFVHQDDTIVKNVVRSYDNGQAHVIVYYQVDTKEKIKEEVYYSNGQLDYIGHYKNQLEHGEWRYYWKNGNLKFFEFYINGLEDGEMYDYDEKGNLIATHVYADGILLETRK